VDGDATPILRHSDVRFWSELDAPILRCVSCRLLRSSFCIRFVTTATTNDKNPLFSPIPRALLLLLRLLFLLLL
jgi:hypothetical protein